MTTHQQPSSRRDDATTEEMPDAPPASTGDQVTQDQSADDQSAPVAPGPRAKRLQEIYAQALERVLGKVSWDNVAGCYPTASRRAEGTLRQVQTQIVNQLRGKCEKEFDNIMAARQVVPKLNELESLIGDASRRRTKHKGDTDPTPPHTLPPADILAAHLHPSLVEHRSLLTARLESTQAQNTLLHDEVRRQREELASLLDALDAAAADVRGANAALAPVVEQLAAESRGTGVEIAERTS